LQSIPGKYKDAAAMLVVQTREANANYLLSGTNMAAMKSCAAMLEVQTEANEEFLVIMHQHGAMQPC